MRVGRCWCWPGRGRGRRRRCVRGSHGWSSRGFRRSGSLLLTFTRRAAREMLARTRRCSGRARPGVRWWHVPLDGAPADPGPRGRAGVAVEIRRARCLRCRRSARPVARGAGARGPAATRFPRKGTLLDIYSRCVNAQRPLSEVLAESFPWCEHQLEQLAELFALYGERKRELALLDLDDLLALLARACLRRGRRRAAGGDVRADPGRRVPGSERAPGRDRARAAARAASG